MSSTDLETLSSDLVVYAARLVRAVRRTQQPGEQPAGVRVLSLLDELGPQGVSALAVADRCSQPTMSGTVATLADRGWVEKTPHPEDRRCNLVALTPAGRTELARIRTTNGRAVAERIAAHSTHSTEDLATAVAVLRDVLDTTPQHHLVKGTL